MFFDLSTWHLIQWRYAPGALREALKLRTDYTDAPLHGRLMQVLNERLGHRMANTVEQAKIAASTGDAEAPMPLDWIEPGLGAAITAQWLARCLAQPLHKVVGITDSIASLNAPGSRSRRATLTLPRCACAVSQ